MIRNRIASIVAALALVGGAAAIAVPAYADSIGSMPSGCGISAQTPYISHQTIQGHTYAYIAWGGSGSCGGASSIDYRLVHNYDGLPDARVKDINIPGSVSSYYGTTCDNGGTTQYYSEIAFYGLSSTVQRASATATLNHC